MKQTIKSTITFLILGLILMFCLSLFIYSIESEHTVSHYEDDQITQKIQFYQQNKEKFNSVFIGTSRIYRQVNPFIFDSLMGNTNSYNAAHANLRPYRIFDYSYNLDLSENVKYVFLEMLPPSRIGGNYNANPELLSITPHKYWAILDFCLKSNYPLKFKAYYFVSYTETFLYKYLGFGLRKYISVLLNDEEAELEPLFYNLDNTKGYLPYEQELALHKNEDLEKRRESFVANANQILSNSIKDSKISTTNKGLTTDAYIQDLIDLEDYFFEKGIKVYHIVSPRKKPWDLAYIEVMKSFVKGAVIDLSSPTEYPQFYVEKYSFDANHLNQEGSIIFTKELHEAFKALK